MRTASSICFVAGWMLAGCATHVGDIHVYGAVWAVSREDIRAAVAAARAAPRWQEPIAYVDIAGHNTITIVHLSEGLPTYFDVNRVGGRWRYMRSYFYIE